MTDTADLETLWHDYHDRMYGYVLMRIHDHDVTSDIVSCIFLRAAVAIRNGNGYKADPTGWLFTIARSVIIDHWRVWRHMPTVDWDAQVESSDTDPTLHDQAEKTMANEQVHWAITQLEENQKVIVRLRLEGYDNGEIAAKMGTTEMATRAVVTRAYRNLRQWLTEAA